MPYRYAIASMCGIVACCALSVYLAIVSIEGERADYVAAALALTTFDLAVLAMIHRSGARIPLAAVIFLSAAVAYDALFTEYDPSAVSRLLGYAIYNVMMLVAVGVALLTSLAGHVRRTPNDRCPRTDPGAPGVVLHP